MSKDQHIKQWLIMYVFNFIIPFIVLYVYWLKITLRERVNVRLIGTTKNYRISLLGLFFIILVNSIILITYII